MKITSLEGKRKQKEVEQRLKLPVYDQIWKDEDGNIKGNKIDFVEIPKHLIDGRK